MAAQKPKRKEPRKRPAPPANGTGPLAAFLTLDAYMAQHTSAIFPSRGSLDWFIRQHRRELAEAGGLLLRGGRHPTLVDATKFDEAVAAILRGQRERPAA